MIAIQMKERNSMCSPAFTCIRHKHMMLEGLERITSQACKWMSTTLLSRSFSLQHHLIACLEVIHNAKKKVKLFGSDQSAVMRSWRLGAAGRCQ